MCCFSAKHCVLLLLLLFSSMPSILPIYTQCGYTNAARYATQKSTLGIYWPQLFQSPSYISLPKNIRTECSSRTCSQCNSFKCWLKGAIIKPVYCCHGELQCRGSFNVSFFMVMVHKRSSVAWDNWDQLLEGTNPCQDKSSQRLDSTTRFEVARGSLYRLVTSWCLMSMKFVEMRLE